MNDQTSSHAELQRRSALTATPMPSARAFSATTQRKRPWRVAIAAAAALAMLLPLAACEGQIPQTKSSSSALAVPDVTPAQERKIRSSILDVMNKANNAKSSEGLNARLADPALAIRTSELAIAKATGKLDAKTAIPSDVTQIVIPTNAGWPRSMFTITTTTEDQQSKRLLVLTQDAPRTNYRLWAVARLFQGAKLPKFAIPSIGSQLGSPQDLGLVMTPEEAVRQYADVLQQGAQSKFANAFAEDYFRQDLSKLAQTVQEGMKRNNGTQEQRFSPVEGQLRVMRSTDGGDLVVAQINSEWTRKAGDGRESQPASDAEKALFGAAKPTSTMKVTYVNVIALYVPPARSGQKVVAVGAERQPIKVEAL